MKRCSTLLIIRNVNKKYTKTILAHFSDYQKYKNLTIHSGGFRETSAHVTSLKGAQNMHLYIRLVKKFVWVFPKYLRVRVICLRENMDKLWLTQQKRRGMWHLSNSSFIYYLT